MVSYFESPQDTFSFHLLHMQPYPQKSLLKQPRKGQKVEVLHSGVGISQPQASESLPPTSYESLKCNRPPDGAADLKKSN